MEYSLSAVPHKNLWNYCLLIIFIIIKSDILASNYAYSFMRNVQNANGCHSHWGPPPRTCLHRIEKWRPHKLSTEIDNDATGASALVDLERLVSRRLHAYLKNRYNNFIIWCGPHLLFRNFDLSSKGEYDTQRCYLSILKSKEIDRYSQAQTK